MMTELQVIKGPASPEAAEGASIEVDARIAEAPYLVHLIKDAVVYQQAKARQGTHAVRNRARVRGSRAKLYRQKGTGRARAGNAQATQRRGGGVVHGPQPRSHRLNMNKKGRKAALRAALAERIRGEAVTVVDHLNLESHKTRPFARWLEGFSDASTLIVEAAIDARLELASRNLPHVTLIHYTQLNVYNLLSRERLVVTREAWRAIEERLVA